jgi:hypothetical protein
MVTGKTKSDIVDFTKNEDMRVKEKVTVAIEILFKNDAFLLENDVHERAITHKFAEYLQAQFPDWHVDCEYNRDHMESKALHTISECDEERKKTKYVVPDIIIHQRNKENNLLVIEVKTGNGKIDCDIKKLELFTSDSKFRYKLGLFVKFDKINEPLCRWFKNGFECPKVFSRIVSET